jgi:hypothetical protein
MAIEERNKCRSSWWRDLIPIKEIQGRGGVDWFEESIRREVGEKKNTFFGKILGWRVISFVFYLGDFLTYL